MSTQVGPGVPEDCGSTWRERAPRTGRRQTDQPALTPPQLDPLPRAGQVLHPAHRPVPHPRRHRPALRARTLPRQGLDHHPDRRVADTAHVDDNELVQANSNVIRSFMLVASSTGLRQNSQHGEATSLTYLATPPQLRRAACGRSGPERSKPSSPARWPDTTACAGDSRRCSLGAGRAIRLRSTGVPLAANLVWILGPFYATSPHGQPDDDAAQDGAAAEDQGVFVVAAGRGHAHPGLDPRTSGTVATRPMMRRPLLSNCPARPCCHRVAVPSDSRTLPTSGLPVACRRR